ncbi:hypothetical protein LC653_23945 [Nostoc sp. CHAB 5784]|uniref:hypothetical protein n=1 Tax=Nostoc mirabile TaxID=2907820 RepID=UPI001E53341E|nr:hypothetical protein [Nostoc mirabile]MCC5666862.1 hypothetical protein [Nostoc mirabile CHAB5784]
MREALNYNPTNGKSEGETKLLEPLGIKAPLVPTSILGQNWLQTQIVTIELVCAEILGNITTAASTSKSQSSERMIPAVAQSQERAIEVKLELELPQLPQVLQNLALLSPLVMESDFIHLQPATKKKLAQTGQKTVKIAPSDRLPYSPIPVPSSWQETKPNLKLSTSIRAPEAWSSITDLLVNVDSADIANEDHVMPANPYLLSQPPTKTRITPQQQTETFTQQITSLRRSSQKPDRRNLELLAKEVYAFIQQQLLIEPEFHSQSSSGRLPW